MRGHIDHNEPGDEDARSPQPGRLGVRAALLTTKADMKQGPG